jgi:oligopeptide/dipeptide ABC transporter ATP-binding protein
MEPERAMNREVASPLLEVRGLRVAFRGEGEQVLALAGVHFCVYPKEVLCLVGESGCGKTLTALGMLGILPSPPAQVEGGRILFQGTDLLRLDEAEMVKIRGKEISMIFQEPMTSLNPVFTVGHQIEEAILLHEGSSPAEARSRVVQLLSDVGIPDPEQRQHDYPHQFSGGQRQRVMIAMALACNPRLLIADEPTTALDVTIQAQILRLFRELQERRGMSLLYITHDLAVVAQLAHRVCVMYAGVVVEEAGVEEAFRSPEHPYTQGLMASLPARARRGQRLHNIEGSVPDPAHRPQGCPFHPRCPLVTSRCRVEFPEMCDFGKGQRARCPVAAGSWAR